jgi:hypothetical protein
VNRPKAKHKETNVVRLAAVTRRRAEAQSPQGPDRPEAAPPDSGSGTVGLVLATLFVLLICLRLALRFAGLLSDGPVNWLVVFVIFCLVAWPVLVLKAYRRSQDE